eukprot:3804867-Rhodomonas_salina.1
MAVRTLHRARRAAQPGAGAYRLGCGEPLRRGAMRARAVRPAPANGPRCRQDGVRGSTQAALLPEQEEIPDPEAAPARAVRQVCCFTAGKHGGCDLHAAADAG